jgi:RNA polymerase sigma factor (sigma-70 family)
LPPQDASIDRTHVEQPLAGAAAFTTVFHEHYGACLRLARRLVRDDGLAHDVVQDVFLAWWRTGGGGYRADRGDLQSWLFTLTHHKAVDALRTADRQRRLLAAAHSTRACEPEERLVDDVVWWELGKQSLIAAMLTLPPKQREVLGLAYDAGLTQAEIANRLGIPLGTVKSRTHAGMLRLRAALSGTWTPTGPTAEPPPDVASPSLVPHVRSSSVAQLKAHADLALREEVEVCAIALTRIAADETEGAPRAAAVVDRAAALINRYGEAGTYGLIVALARAAATGSAATSSASDDVSDDARVRAGD